MEQLKTYLKKLLTGSVVCNMESELIQKEVEKLLLEKQFELDVFKFVTDASIDTISDLIKGYYYNRIARLIHKCIDLNHNGLDLSFENEKEKIFIVLSPFTGFFKISVITLAK